jgi:ATP adenylyltransferase
MDRLWTPWRYAYITDSGPAGRKGVPEALAAWPGDCACVFCNLIGSANWAIEQGMSPEEAEAPGHILLRAEYCFLVLNAFPYSSGHLMVIPYQHLQSLTALPVAAAEEMIRLTQRAETALRATYKPNGVNLGMNLGEAAGAGVAEHIHMHVLPRWVGDSNFMSVIAETRVLPETLDITWKRLRQAIADAEVI